MESKISTRGIVNVGLPCNLRCKHCYYFHYQKKWKPLWWVMANILLVRLCRMEKIDLTGGEPTLHPHIDALVKYCSLVGFKEVRLVTNGTTAKALTINHPKLRFALSFHSHVASDLEKLTGQYILPSLRRFWLLRGNLVNYVNCVITPFNTDIENIAAGLRKIVGPDVTICFKNLDYNFEHDINNFKMTEFRNKLNESIRKAPGKYDLRFYPFCFRDEDVAADSRSAYTNTYDDNDWLPVISRITPRSRFLKFIFGGKKTREQEAVTQSLVQGKLECAKTSKCSGCKYESRCDGVQKGYLRKFGDAEFRPR